MSKQAYFHKPAPLRGRMVSLPIITKKEQRTYVLGHGTLRVSGESYLSHFNEYKPTLLKTYCE